MPEIPLIAISPWWLFVIAFPVLLLGESLLKRIPVLDRFNIPAPVVGGLVICLGVLILELTNVATIKFLTDVRNPWWTWLVTPEPEWVKGPTKSVGAPLMIGFFTCVGLNGTWAAVKTGKGQILLFLFLSTILAVLQNVVGVVVAQWMGANPLLGVICGALTQTGGLGTSQAFADTIIDAGYAPAKTMGVAAATLGMICGSLIGGPIAAGLIKRYKLVPEKTSPTEDARADKAERAIIDISENEPGIFDGMRAFVRQGRKALVHLLMLAALIKIGAWIGYGFGHLGMIFPTYMGSMLAGLLLRNIFDMIGKPIFDSHVVDLMGGVLLAIFLAMTMTSLNIREVSHGAGPMFAILGAQVVLMTIFSIWVSFRLMGRDYDSAVMASGLCGFGHGATTNAVANMKSITRKFGPAHRAFLVVPMVGAMFIDITNSFNIVWFINHFGTKHGVTHVSEQAPPPPKDLK